MPRARGWTTIVGTRPTRSRCVSWRARETRNRLEVYTCGRETRFADRGRPTGADGGAVALRLMLMSCFLSLPDHAPLASYRLGSSVGVVRYGRALRAVQEVVAKSRRNPDEISIALVAYRGSSRTRGLRRHFGTSDETRRVVDVRYV